MHLLTRIQDPPNFTTPFYITFTRFGLCTFVFYVSAYFVYPFSFKNKKNYKFLLLILILFITANALLRFIVIDFLVPLLANTNRPGNTMYQYFILSLNWWFQYSFFGLAFWYAKRAINTERQLRITETQRLSAEKNNLQLKADNLELKSENLELQNQKLTAEYNFLKSQINPHFLYNTLNYFYAETMVYSPKAAKGISLLSQIMRYSLQPAEADGKVPLADEVLHLNNYLSLQRLRFDEDLHLDCSIPANIPHGYRILPHLLLTLAENAFKHGEPNLPISISLDINNGDVSYIVSNNIRTNGLEKGTGVGLHNMQERLALYYGSDARLEFVKHDGIFTAKLEIKNVVLPEQTPNHIPETTH